MITRGRKSSADDYPEHLNPFADDNEDLRNNRFNTTGRRRARPSLKDAWSGGWEADEGAEPPPAGGGERRPSTSASASASPVVGRRYGAALGRTHSDSYRLRYASRSGYQALVVDAADGGGARQGVLDTQLGRSYSFSHGRRESNPSPALDVAVPVRGPTPARPPPPRLSLSPPPPRPLTQPPPAPTAAPAAPDAAPAGSNWTLAEGGFPQRMPSYRPKKRRAPPPPPQAASPAPAPAPSPAPAPAPAAVSVTAMTHETSDTTGAVQQPAAAEVSETTTVEVAVVPATPPPASTAEPAVVEVSVTEAPAVGGAPAEAATGDQEALHPEAAAPLAEGEDDADLVAADADADASSQPEAAEQRTSAERADTAVERPGGEAAKQPAVPTTTEAVGEEEQAQEGLEKTAGDSETAEPASAAQGEAAVSTESSTKTILSEEATVEIAPQVLTLTIREYKEPTAPSAEVAEVSQEAKDSLEGEKEEVVPVTGPEVAAAAVEVEVKVETATAPEPTGATVGDVPPEETNAEQPSEGGDEVPDEPRKPALASFREDYLTKHYKADLPVLQITESDLADKEEKEEGSPATKAASALPVLHISEEDLRDEPAAEAASEAQTAANGPSPAARERDSVKEGEREAPSLRSRESPQPPPRQSSLQELNSKIYFRVLPPLAGPGGPPQLKTFSPPSSPPGRGPKPQPPLRNGVAGEASPPRTKSPLPTPRRRHQPVQRDA